MSESAVLDEPTPARAGSARHGVFISYARADGAETAAELRQIFAAQGLRVWHDLSDLQGGDDWWLQISEALASVMHVVLVLTDGALRSTIVQRECQTARERGVAVLPVASAHWKPAEGIRVPRWVDKSHRYDPKRDQRLLLNDLQRTPQTRRVPFMVEDLPPDHVVRGEPFDRLVSLLITEDRSNPVAITAALRGAGGYGKTTLARAVCHDRRVRDAYCDGILWLTLGEKPGKAELIERVLDLVEVLTDERPRLTTLDAACTRLREAIGALEMLIVIDDVWQPEHAAPFLFSGSRCSRLITTRLAEVVPSNARQVPVDQMSASESVRLVGHGLEPDGEATDLLQELAQRLGEWPLLLRLANGVIHQRMGTARTGLVPTLRSLHQALDKRGITAFDSRNAGERNRAVALTIGVSLDQLLAEEAEAFFDLAVFPEDFDIPLPVVRAMWMQRHQLDDFEAEDLYLRLAAMSLVLRLDLEGGTIRLHDAIRSFAIQGQPPTELQARHADLIVARCAGQPLAEAAAQDDYLLRYVALHLERAVQVTELAELVRTPGFMAARLDSHKSWALLEDMARAQRACPDHAELDDLFSELSRTSHQLERINERQALLDTLHARLPGLHEPAAAHSTHQLVTLAPFPGQQRSLTRVISFEDERISAVAVCDSDAQALWWAHSGRGFLTDMRTGRVLRSFTAPSRITCLAVASGRRWAVTIGQHRTLSVWDLRTGERRCPDRRLPAPAQCCVIDESSGRVAVGGTDGTITVWSTGTTIGADTPPDASLRGHVAAVGACALDDGSRALVSVGADGRGMVWDLETSSSRMRLADTALPLTACAFSANRQQIITGGSDGWLRIWQLTDGRCTASQKAHRGAVRSVLAAPDGSTLSVGADGSLVRWQADQGHILRLATHSSGGLRSASFERSGVRAVTVSDMGIGQVWTIPSTSTTAPSGSTARRDRLLAISASGRAVLLHSRVGVLELWTPPWKTPRTLADDETRLEKGLISADDRAIALIGRVRGLRLLKLDEVEPTTQFLAPAAEWASFTPDGKQLAWQTPEGRLQAIDVLSGERNRDRLLDRLWASALVGPRLDWLVVYGEHATIQPIDGWDGSTLAPLTPDANTFALSGHRGAAARLRFSADPARLFSCGDDGVLCEWEWATRQRTFASVALPHWASAIVPLADGQMFAACWDGHLYRIGQKPGDEPVDLGALPQACLDADHDQLQGTFAACGIDGSLALWSAEDVSPRLTCHTGKPAWCCALTPGGTHLLAGHDDGALTCWDIVDDRVTTWSTGQHGQINRIRMDTASQTALVVADDGSAVWLDWQTGAVRAHAVLSDIPLVDADICPSGAKAVLLDGAGRLLVLESLATSPVQIIQPTSLAAPPVACAISPDGMRVAVSQGVTIEVWDLADGSRVSALPGTLDVRALPWHPEANLRGEIDGLPIVLPASDGSSETGPRFPDENPACRRAVALETDESGNTQLRFGMDLVPLHHDAAWAETIHRYWSAAGLDIDPESRWAAMCDRDGILRIIDLAQSRLLSTIHTGCQVQRCAWLEGGKVLLLLCREGLAWMTWRD